MTQPRTVFAVCVILFLAPYSLLAQTGDNAADLAAIRETAKSYVEAFERGDAKAIAALWAEDGVYADRSGDTVQGRDAIEKAFEEFFSKNKGAKLQIEIEALHLPAEDMAIEIGDSVTTVGESAPKSGARYKAIHVKKDGAWKLQSVEEGPPLPPSNYQHLKDLEWLLGNWMDESVLEDKQKVVVHTQARWAMNRNFIVRTFTETLDNRVTMTATQRVGWYAPAKEIRSWTFDSDGGISVGVWSKDGDKWVVKSDHVLRDGSQATETETATIDGVHTHTWRLTERKLAGKQLPDLAIKVQRYGAKKP